MKKLVNLTYPQKSILLTEKFYKNASINNICGTAIIDSVLDFDALKQAINVVISNNLGITMCQATYLMMGENLYDVIPRFKDKIFFVPNRSAYLTE